MNVERFAKTWGEFGLKYGLIYGVLMAIVIMTIWTAVSAFAIYAAPLLLWTGITLSVTGFVYFVAASTILWIPGGWLYENIFKGAIKGHKEVALMLSGYTIMLAAVAGMVGLAAFTGGLTLTTAVGGFISAFVMYWVIIKIMDYIGWKVPE